MEDNTSEAKEIFYSELTRTQVELISHFTEEDGEIYDMCCEDDKVLEAYNKLKEWSRKVLRD